MAGFKMNPGSKEKHSDDIFSDNSPMKRMGTPMMSPLKNNGKKRISSSEAIVAARGGTDPDKYAAYKAAGGKLNATQAARIGYKSPAESAERLRTSTPESNPAGHIDVGQGVRRGAGGEIVIEDSPINKNGFKIKKGLKPGKKGGKPMKGGAYDRKLQELKKINKKK